MQSPRQSLSRLGPGWSPIVDDWEWPELKNTLQGTASARMLLHCGSTATQEATRTKSIGCETTVHPYMQGSSMRARVDPEVNRSGMRAVPRHESLEAEAINHLGSSFASSRAPLVPPSQIRHGRKHPAIPLASSQVLLTCNCAPDVDYSRPLRDLFHCSLDSQARCDSRFLW